MGKKNTGVPNPIFGSSVWVLLSCTIATTLYFNVKLLDPFNTPKLVIILLSASWLFGHLVISYYVQKIDRKSIELVIIILCSIFILSLTAALLKTDPIVTGLIGDSQRRNGFLAYLSLIIIFLFSIRFIDRFEIIKIFRIAIIIGLLLGIYGFLQINGKDFVVWSNPYNSMIATLGNPNFASALLAVLVLISASALFVSFISKFLKIIAFGVIVLALFAIVESSSRQGLIVVGFGVIFYSIMSSIIRKTKLRFIVVPISLVILFLSIFGMLQKGPFASFLYKDSVSVRGFYWRAGWKMFQENPIFGVGLDRYGSYFKLLRESEYPLRYGYEITSSNAHNTFIQLFATGGIFVGLSYLTLIVVTFILGLKLVLKSDSQFRPVNLGLLTAWVGFQSQSFISIDNIGISIWGWLLGGSIIGLYIEQEKKITLNIAQNSHNKITKAVKSNLIQPLISSLFLIPTIWISSLLIQMESNIFKIQMMLNSIQTEQDREIIVRNVIKLENNPLSDPSYIFQGATALVNAGNLGEAYKIVSSLKQIDPNNLVYLDWLAKYESIKKNVDREIELREKIRIYDPWNAKNLLKLGELYKKVGNLVQASEVLHKVLSFTENSDLGNIAREMLE